MSDSKERDEGLEEQSQDGLGEDSRGEDEDWERLAQDPEAASRVLRTLDGLLPGVLKRAATQGVHNILSEDGIRSILTDNKKLPKEGGRSAHVTSRWHEARGAPRRLT